LGPEIWRTPKQFGRFIVLYFFVSFVSLLIGFWPGIMSSAWVSLLADGGGDSLCTASAERSPLSIVIGCGSFGFIPLRTSDYCFVLCILFFVSLIFGHGHPRRCAPRKEDKVTAPCDLRPGKHQCISIVRYDT
jgi:hypothetical protein